MVFNRHVGSLAYVRPIGVDPSAVPCVRRTITIPVVFEVMDPASLGPPAGSAKVASVAAAKEPEAPLPLPQGKGTSATGPSQAVTAALISLLPLSLMEAMAANSPVVPGLADQALPAVAAAGCASAACAAPSDLCDAYTLLQASCGCLCRITACSRP
jgi:hypothetical protein